MRYISNQTSVPHIASRRPCIPASFLPFVEPFRRPCLPLTGQLGLLAAYLEFEAVTRQVILLVTQVPMTKAIVFETEPSHGGPIVVEVLF